MRTNINWDAIGIGASLACAIHCVLLPVIFTTVTLFGIEILENPYLEGLTLLVSMSVGGWAIWRGYKKLHHKKNLVVYFFMGLVMMMAGNFVSFKPLEMGLKIVGAVFIITAHVKNWKACKHCEVCNPE
ncbi:MerC domain-containing protein [Chitinophaga sp. CF118]|uniref:MerC domain-containing protein n=1 Tax=Chitinophaga sp. CF118 TaxID=1884367 RepID=UPI0015A7177E|nr:MerC domain-containing protein [Chitinophaga sp. CF118]